MGSRIYRDCIGLEVLCQFRRRRGNGKKDLIPAFSVVMSILLPNLKIMDAVVIRIHFLNSVLETDLVLGRTFLFIHIIGNRNINISVDQSNNAGSAQKRCKYKSQNESDVFHNCKTKSNFRTIRKTIIMNCKDFIKNIYNFLMF